MRRPLILLAAFATAATAGHAALFVVLADMIPAKDMLGTEFKTDEAIFAGPGLPSIGVPTDTPGGREEEAKRRLALAKQMHDPDAGPRLRRTLRREVWISYHTPIAELHLEADRSRRVFELLVARAEAPYEALYAASKQGADPSSGAVSKAVADATRVAENELVSFLGAAEFSQLESRRKGHDEQLAAIRLQELSAQRSRELKSGGADRPQPNHAKLVEMVRQDIENGEAAEAELAGCPLSAAQLQDVEAAFLRVHANDSAENPTLRRQRDDPKTGLRATDVAYLEAIKDVVTPQQFETIRTYRQDVAAAAREIGLSE